MLEPCSEGFHGWGGGHTSIKNLFRVPIRGIYLSEKKNLLPLPVVTNIGELGGPFPILLEAITVMQ